MRSVVLGVCLSLGLAGCVSEAEKARRAEVDRIDDAKAAVAGLLFDPTSPLFTEVRAGEDAVCGFVNGKNRFGAYAGKKRFVSPTYSDPRIEEDPETVSPEARGIARVNACYFDTEYRNCMGEDLGDPLARCAPRLAEDMDRALGRSTTALPRPEAPSEDQAVQLCLMALDREYDEKLLPADLIARTSEARQNPVSLSWLVSIDWTVAGTSPAIGGTGRCNVVEDGTAWVNDLGAR